MKSPIEYLMRHEETLLFLTLRDFEFGEINYSSFFNFELTRFMNDLERIFKDEER